MRPPLHSFGMLVAAALLVVAATARPASAERVLVQAPSGEEGHAWLFGSRGECWLAMPKHVVADPFDQRPRSFLFTDRMGRPGEAETPISVDEVPGAVDASGGIEDLAFARVASGRAKGECLSRLGLPSTAYDSTLAAGLPLTVFNLLSTSFGVFQMDVTRGRVDVAGGGLLILKTRHLEDAVSHVKRGISGSTAEIERSGATYPFAMILQADPDTGSAKAMRFDLIRAAFEVVEASDLDRRRGDRAQNEGVPYRILGFDGNTIAGAPSALEASGCWRVAPRGGSTTISVTVELEDPKDKVRAMSFQGTEDCEAKDGGTVTVAQRIRSEDAWSRASTCRLSGDGSTAEPCRLELRGPRQLRITVEARGPVAVGGYG